MKPEFIKERRANINTIILNERRKICTLISREISYLAF